MMRPLHNARFGAEASKDKKLKITKNALGNRVAFAASMMNGMGITESERLSQAATEIRKLDKELEK